MKTSAVRLQYCVLFSPSPLFPRQGLGACNLYHTPATHPGICRLFNVGPIVLHPARHCNASHSCFLCFVAVWFALATCVCSSMHGWAVRALGTGRDSEMGAGVIGWPYFACASITSAECSSMQISLPLWEEAHVSEVINFTLECQLWCWCDVFQIELSHQKGVNLGIWQMK